jgi:hypothetical protein
MDLFKRAALVATVVRQATSLRAQSSASVAPGARVRVILNDSLRVAPLAPARMVLFGTLRHISADDRHPAGAGAVGVTLGALLGALSPYEHWRRVRD